MHWHCQERKPKASKKTAAERRTVVPKKKVGIKDKTIEKRVGEKEKTKGKKSKEKKEKKDETPFNERTWQLDQVCKYCVFMNDLNNSSLAVQESDSEEVPRSGDAGRQGVLHAQALPGDHARYSDQ